MNISHKLCVPSLQRDCLTFLVTHAAGNPIKAMRIAELFGEEELYRLVAFYLFFAPEESMMIIVQRVESVFA